MSSPLLYVTTIVASWKSLLSPRDHCHFIIQIPTYLHLPATLFETDADKAIVCIANVISPTSNWKYQEEVNEIKNTWDHSCN